MISSNPPGIAPKDVGLGSGGLHEGESLKTGFDGKTPVFFNIFFIILYMVTVQRMA